MSSNPSQPSSSGDGNTNPVPTAKPQPASTRLSGPSVTVTDGGPMPFTNPPARPGNVQDTGAKPFRVGGG